ncbi:MAG: BON domain-containing protein, partial [Terriglobia bacterium]
MKRRSGFYQVLIPVILALMVGACSKMSSSPDDSEIVSAIEAKLYQSPDLKGLSVNVSSNHGVVTLTGAVNAPLEKLAVEGVAMKTTGVKQVADQLQVTEAQAQTSAAAVPPAAPAEEAKPQAHPRRRAKRRQIAENREPQAQSENDASNPAEPAQPAPMAQPTPPAESAPTPPPPPPPVQVTIPSGTTISVRLIDSISSATAQPGQVYAASLLAPVVANDRVMIPKGADAKVRVTDVKSAGHYKGQSELQLELVSLSYNGADYPLQTGYYTKEGASRGKNTAEKVGGGAALGALLGAVIGHGKGAGIGAAIGGAAGTVDQTATRGQQVT